MLSAFFLHFIACLIPDLYQEYRGSSDVSSTKRFSDRSQPEADESLEVCLLEPCTEGALTRLISNKSSSICSTLPKYITTRSQDTFNEKFHEKICRNLEIVLFVGSKWR